MHSARARPNGPAARAGTEGTAENMTLAQLPVGQSARIAAVGGEGALRRRLLDMGLTPGTTVMVRKICLLYTSNHHLRNAGLSLKSKGLLSMMLSLPEDWNYTTRGLAKICKAGTDSIGSALKELERAGYVVCNQLQIGRAHV